LAPHAVLFVKPAHGIGVPEQVPIVVELPVQTHPAAWQ
jgi:hypothetical protein